MIHHLIKSDLITSYEETKICKYFFNFIGSLLLSGKHDVCKLQTLVHEYFSFIKNHRRDLYYNFYCTINRCNLPSISNLRYGKVISQYLCYKDAVNKMVKHQYENKMVKHANKIVKNENKKSRRCDDFGLLSQFGDKIMLKIMYYLTGLDILSSISIACVSFYKYIFKFSDSGMMATRLASQDYKVPHQDLIEIVNRLKQKKIDVSNELIFELFYFSPNSFDFYKGIVARGAPVDIFFFWYSRYFGNNMKQYCGALELYFRTRNLEDLDIYHAVKYFYEMGRKHQFIGSRNMIVFYFRTFLFGTQNLEVEKIRFVIEFMVPFLTRHDELLSDIARNYLISYFCQVDIDDFLAQDREGDPMVEIDIKRMTTFPDLLVKYSKIRTNKYLYHFYGEKSLLYSNYTSESELKEMFGPNFEVVVELYRKCYDALSGFL